ncbi:hypothetical protein GSI_08537 [Ganoderma sinense ZZ0214-1]|uniref:Uncharacterized protein n=1 Tax=Ganoderma sinense ZZ0214-1 TaxID=1077348 RepID=A0A2G8S3Z6_9APHY|nr:hypothetical protein GSI_08537 [Ganoderma sinense ZZ0214-1]
MLLAASSSGAMMFGYGSVEEGKANYDMRSAIPTKPSRAAFGTPASPTPFFPDRGEAVWTPLDAASPGADTRTTEQSPYQIPNSPGGPRVPPPAAGAPMRSPHQPLGQQTGHRPSPRLSMSLAPLREAEA